MIELKKMSEADFNQYKAWAISHYASEKMKGENLSADAANKIAIDSFQSLLPEGEKTPGQHLFRVFKADSKEPIGILWMAEKNEHGKKFAFIYDIFIQAEFRGKGLGKRLVEESFHEARKLGLKNISLHVFGNNTHAISLYEKLGFKTTNRIMAKEI